MDSPFPILEFDGEADAVIEPSKVIPPIDIPERCVLPIYHTVIARLLASSRLEHVTNIHTAMGPLPVYKMRHDNAELAVAHPGLAAPLAAGVMEELIASGCRKFIACGSAGVLDSALSPGTVVVPSSAVRDEGTSYHYIEPAREIAADPRVVKIISSVLERHGVKYRVGKTWTTDAFYRETRPRVARRKSEGCLTVEMECAAFLAVSQFRAAVFGQILATGDDVSGVDWDPRDWNSATHSDFWDKLFWLSVEACVAL
jgi:uridine phosphorylase